MYMAGLYFHIPFCKRICAYCDFYRSAELKYIDSVVDAMHCEMDEQPDFLGDKTIRTIYFGGGTPSLLAPATLQGLIDHAARLFDCHSVDEITVEANPDDVTQEYVEQLRKTAVNRVSLGVQSFDDDVLKVMNRRHSALEAQDAVRRLQDSGIDNITIDLIFGVDGVSDDVLCRTIDVALSLDVQHISAYHLTIEPNTAFHRRLLKGLMREVSEECSEREYALIEQRLCEAGFEHYEVSNYAKAGFRSRHNSSYWHGAEYLGIGAGAHSYNGKVRRWSSQSLPQYINQREYESELLTPQDHYNEYIMTSLRCCEGIDLRRIDSQFGHERTSALLAEAKRWLDNGDLLLEGEHMRIPSRRFLTSDAIIESLFEA